MKVRVKALPGNNFGSILAPYNIKISTVYGIIKISRGSHAVLRNIYLYPRKKCGANEVILDIESFCEFSDCSIVVGGEHSEMLTPTFGASPNIYFYLQSKNAGDQPKLKGIIKIGSNTVVSHAALILSGVTIGENCIVGAGALVTKDIPDNSICAGVPAKQIKKRNRGDVPFWMLQDDYLSRIMSGEKFEIADHMRYQDSDCFFNFDAAPDDKGKIGGLIWKGVEKRGIFTPVERLPEAFKKYMSQIGKGGEILIWDGLFSEI